jgi:hypothetical protein
MFLLLLRGGSRPGGRGTFLCFAKKGVQKKSEPNALTLRCGHAAVLGLDGVTLNSL